MFEELTARAARTGRDRAAARVREIAARLAAGVPPGIAVEQTPDGVRLSGRALLRRYALEPALRWLAADARR